MRARLITAAAALLLFTAGAQASGPYTQRAPQEQPFSWSGIYIGVGAGYAIGDTKLSFGGASIEGASSRGFEGDGRIGLDYHMTGTPIVLGVFGCYNVGETEFKVNGGGGFNATITPTWCIGGRAGLAMANKSLLYVGYAYSKADFDTSAGGLGVGELTGNSGLVGLETYLAPQLTIAGEYTFTRYDGIDIGAVHLDPDVHAFKLRLNWRPLSGVFNN